MSGQPERGTTATWRRRALEVGLGLVVAVAALLLAMEWTYPCTPLGCVTPDPDRLARQVPLPLNVRGSLPAPEVVAEAGCRGPAAGRQVRLAGDRREAVADYLLRALPGRRWSPAGLAGAGEAQLFVSRWRAAEGSYRLAVAMKLTGPGPTATGPAAQVTVVTLLVSAPQADGSACLPRAEIAS